MAGLYTAAQAARSAGFTAARTGADCAPAFKAWALAHGYEPRNSPLYPAWRDGFAGAQCPPIVKATACATCRATFGTGERRVTVVKQIAGPEHDAAVMVYCGRCFDRAEAREQARRLAADARRGGLGGSWARLGAR